MAFIHGKSTKVLFNNTNLSAYLNTATTTRTQELAETTTFQASAKTWLAGFGDATVACEGFCDVSAGAIDAILVATLGSASNGILTIIRGTDATGSAIEVAAVKTTSYEISSDVGDVTKVSVEFQCDGALETGAILHALEAETATAADSAVNNGAQTTTGAIATLQITAASAGDTLDVIVEDSDNGTSGWATIGTFAQKAAVGSERITIVGTVKQYTRASWTIAGTEPSFTFSVALART